MDRSWDEVLCFGVQKWWIIVRGIEMHFFELILTSLIYKNWPTEWIWMNSKIFCDVFIQRNPAGLKK